jgi:hypothetical protein
MYLCYVDETGMDEDSDAIITVIAGGASDTPRGA